MRKIVLLLFTMALFITATAQVRTISGRIIDEKGDAVPFASIKVENAKGGTAADANGVFTIRAASGAVLDVSAGNYSNNKVTIGAENSITVSLVKGTNELSSVVVTTALGVQRQAKDLGYATASLNNKTLIQAKSVNVEQALNGKISGVNISTVNSGVFENAKINIRGIRSLTGNNNPMLVVDGAQTPLAYLSAIPPDDVQDLTVLKSAASAALYGPNAVNGVIVITTKRGGKKPSVTLSSTIQATKISFFPKFQKEFGDGAGETFDIYGNYTYVPYENEQYGPKFDNSVIPIGPVLEDGSQQMGRYNADHYQDKIKFFNTGSTLQNSASIAGEDFFVSIEDAKIKGLVPDDANRRTSIRFNGGKKYGNFSIDYSFNYVLQNSNVVNEAGFQTTFPGAYDGGLFLLVEQVNNSVPLLSYADLNSKYGQFSNYYDEYAVNPYWLIANIRSMARNNNLLGNITANYQVFPWLKATARVSSNLDFVNTTNTNAPVVVSDYAAAHRNAVQYTNRDGFVSTDQYSNSQINFDYFLSGGHDLFKDFSVKYLAGSSVNDNLTNDVQVGGNNLVVPFLYSTGVRSGDASVNSYSSTIQGNYKIQSRLVSAYGTIGFSYKGWANVEFTGRNDWDSRLLQQNRSFFYPAVNAALVLSDAIPSLHSSRLFSYVKLRGAISKSGNVNLNPYNLSATYSQNFGFPYGSTAGFTANDLIPSDNLKPEFVNTKEGGIELGFLKNRINFEATYFNQLNTNQILQVTRSVATGYTAELANAADFKNYGVESDLSFTPLINLGKGRFDVRINATYNNNQITSTLGNVPIILSGTGSFIQQISGGPTVNQIAAVGGPAFAFQVSDYARDPQGHVIVDPKTGNPTQASGLITVGRSLPLWVVGITPSYSLGNFSVSMTWDYKGGNDFFSGLGADEDFAGISLASAEYGRQRFVIPNSVINVGTADAPKYQPNTNIETSDGNYTFWTGANTRTSEGTNYMSSAAAWRLRELNITYNFPFKWIGVNKVFKRLSLSLVGKNLLLIVPKSNLWGDPEFNYSATGNTFGVASGYQSPASRLFGASITAQF